VITVVVVLILAVLGAGLGGRLASGLQSTIDGIFGGGSPAAGARGLPVSPGGVQPDFASTSGGGGVAPTAIVKTWRQGSSTYVETGDGSVYELNRNPEPGDQAAGVNRDVLDQILKPQDYGRTYRFVYTNGADPRPDLVSYGSLAPGQKLDFIEVKSVAVGDGGAVSWRNAANNIVNNAIERQGAGEAVVVFDSPPNGGNVLSMVQRTQSLLENDGVTARITIAVRSSSGTLHEAWTGELGAGRPAGYVDDLGDGQAAAKAAQPNDPRAGSFDPDTVVPGEPGGGDGGDGGGGGGGIDLGDLPIDF
jgi:hypothetical protein